MQILIGISGAKYGILFTLILIQILMAPYLGAKYAHTWRQSMVFLLYVFQYNKIAYLAPQSGAKYAHTRRQGMCEYLYAINSDINMYLQIVKWVT